MNSRDRILKDLRAGPPVSSPLPEIPVDWPTPEDLLATTFGNNLETAGGKAYRAADKRAVAIALEQMCQEAGLTRVGSVVQGIGQGIGQGIEHSAGQLPGRTIVDVSAVKDPHDLTDIHLAIVPGRFAVAENGAVWVSGADLQQRALCFACEHLALVVPADQIVFNMHQAYRRLRPEESSFGVFISGPSKTADIEQALVLGAHGPRSLAVFLVDRL